MRNRALGLDCYRCAGCDVPVPKDVWKLKGCPHCGSRWRYAEVGVEEVFRWPPREE